MFNKVMNTLRRIFTTNTDLRDVETGARRVEEAEHKVRQTLQLLQVRKDVLLDSHSERKGRV